jgi:hypothetical protein
MKRRFLTNGQDRAGQDRTGWDRTGQGRVGTNQEKRTIKRKRQREKDEKQRTKDQYNACLSIVYKFEISNSLSISTIFLHLPTSISTFIST